MTHVPRPADRVWGAYLAAVVVVGAVFVARAPAESVRALPFSAVGYIVVAGCCGVAADALWNRRPWRRRAVDAITMSMVLTGLVRWIERSPAGTELHPFLVPEWLANAPLFFLLVYLLTDRKRAWHKLRVPRP